MKTGCLTVSSGRLVDVVNIQAEDIQLEDIAHSLAKLCRFGGHTREFYSVAQHSVRVARSLPPELMLDGLLHDATEAYMIDLPRPLKAMLPAYRDLEAKVQRVIEFKFGVDCNHPLVKAADESALLAEFQELMPAPPPPEWFRGVTPMTEARVFFTPEEAKGAFLIMFANAAAYKIGSTTSTQKAC